MNKKTNKKVWRNKLKNFWRDFKIFSFYIRRYPQSLIKALFYFIFKREKFNRRLKQLKKIILPVLPESPSMLNLILSLLTPQKMLKGIKILLTKGPKGLIEKIKTQKEQLNQSLTINQQYQLWLKKHYPTPSQLKRQVELSNKFKYKPLISLITPVYDPEENHLIECIHSVLNQSYQNWELCLVDDASKNKNIRAIIKKYAQKDKRIKYKFRKTNGHICRASNDALKMATGEYIGLLDHDDFLWPNALYEVIKLLNEKPHAQFIYSDEDKLDEDGKTHVDPFFKPDWSPDLLYSFMYTGHFTVYRKNLVHKVKGFTIGLEYSQDYDLALKISEKTPNIFHIATILYSWRIHAKSQAGGGKPYARKTNLRALYNHMLRRGLKGKVIEYPYANKFNYVIEDNKKVSIIIPTDNYVNSIKLVNLIINNTSYVNYDINLVINPKIGNKIQNIYKNKTNIKIIPYNEEFNFSRKCNIGVNKSNGDYLIILNDDVKILDKNWIERLIEFFQRKEVGAVSPKLVYEDNTIQYAGMVTNVRGLIGTAFHKKTMNSYEYFNLIQSTRNVSILCGACFAIPRKIFQEIGGFDEKNTPINHSDIDLSFKIRDHGYLIIYTPFTTLIHYGHKSLAKFNKNKVKYPDLFLLNRWGDKIAYDPYFPPFMRDFLYEHSLNNFKIISSLNEIKEKRKGHMLFISHESSLTGAPLLIYWLAKELKKIGYNIIFMVSSYGRLIDLLKKENFTVIVDEEFKLYVRNETANFFRNFDYILCNTIETWPCVLAARKWGVKTLFYIHESKYGLNKLKNDYQIKLAFNLSSVVIFPNRKIQAKYLSMVPKINSEVLLPGIEIQKKIHKKKDKNNFLILHVGSIEYRKGQDILVDSILQLPKHVINKIKIVFVGRIININYYLKLISKLKNCDYEFTNEINNNEVIKLYKKASLFICSSRDETGPLTLLEAMSNKVPVVTTKVGIASEIINSNKNGIVLNNFKPITLRNIIHFVINKPKYLNEIAENGYETVKKFFTIDKYLNNFIKIIKKIN